LSGAALFKPFVQVIPLVGRETMNLRAHLTVIQDR